MSISHPSRTLLLLLGAATVYLQMLGPTSTFSRSTMVQPPTNHQQEPTSQRKRTAAVWTTVALTTECEAARLKHLVETAGIDVWILHAHHVLQAEGKLKEIAESEKRIASIPGLQQAAQRETPIIPFDGLSGSSKSSFLQFMTDHPEYDYAWHVETDLFFTGPWNDLFQPEDDSSDKDFLTASVIDRNGTQWFWLPPRNECNLLQHQCRDMGALQIGWMLSRVSSRFAQSLLQDVLEDQIHGHHEAIVGPFCTLKNFTYDWITPSRIGSILFGHKWGRDERQMNVAYHFDTNDSNATLMKPGKLLHPVKCVAYFNTGDEDEDDDGKDHQKHPIHKTIQKEIEAWTAVSASHKE